MRIKKDEDDEYMKYWLDKDLSLKCKSILYLIIEMQSDNITEQEIRSALVEQTYKGNGIDILYKYKISPLPEKIMMLVNDGRHAIFSGLNSLRGRGYVYLQERRSTIGQVSGYTYHTAEIRKPEWSLIYRQQKLAEDYSSGQFDKQPWLYFWDLKNAFFIYLTETTVETDVKEQVDIMVADYLELVEPEFHFMEIALMYEKLDAEQIGILEKYKEYITNYPIDK